MRTVAIAALLCSAVAVAIAASDGKDPVPVKGLPPYLPVGPDGQPVYPDPTVSPSERVCHRTTVDKGMDRRYLYMQECVGEECCTYTWGTDPVTGWPRLLMACEEHEVSPATCWYTLWDPT